MSRRSFHTRLLLTASIALLAFFAISALLLDIIFRQTSENILANRMQVVVMSLIASTELDAHGRMLIPDVLPEHRLERPGSGLYAQIRRGDGAVAWRSPSTMGHEIRYPPVVMTGEQRLVRTTKDESVPLFVMSFGVAWEGPRGETTPFVFDVAQSLEPYESQLWRFRRNLLGSFLLLGIVLLVVQMLVIRWGLRPLRQMGVSLRDMQSGRQEALTGDYPRELSVLAHTINGLVNDERAHLARYRNSLSDLAHSLKTPLAVLSTLRDDPGMDSSTRDTLNTQVERMNAIVEYQLRRAAAAGAGQTMKRTAVAPVAEKIVDSLAKVYYDRGLQLEQHVDPGLVFQGEEEDLMEVIGNLMDNACKWARERVELRVNAAAGSRGRMLEVIVGDDGQGMHPEAVDRLSHRGVRGDESVEGQGIGLAVVRDIAVMYGGEIQVGQSAACGAEVRVLLPAAGND